MSRSLNKVTLIGNVGQDPELRTTPGGMRIAKVSLATSRTFKDRQGNEAEKTEWHRLTFWDKLADVVERYVKKGDRLYVEGRIEYSTTGEGKDTKYFTDINVREMIMLGSPSGGDRQGGSMGDSWGRARDRGRGNAEEEGRGGHAPSSDWGTPAGRPGNAGGRPSHPFDDDDDLPF